MTCHTNIAFRRVKRGKPRGKQETRNQKQDKNGSRIGGGGVTRRHGGGEVVSVPYLPSASCWRREFSSSAVRLAHLSSSNTWLRLLIIMSWLFSPTSKPSPSCHKNRIKRVSNQLNQFSWTAEIWVDHTNRHYSDGKASRLEHYLLPSITTTHIENTSYISSRIVSTRKKSK